MAPPLLNRFQGALLGAAIAAPTFSASAAAGRVPAGSAARSQGAWLLPYLADLLTYHDQPDLWPQWATRLPPILQGIPGYPEAIAAAVNYSLHHDSPPPVQAWAEHIPWPTPLPNPLNTLPYPPTLTDLVGWADPDGWADLVGWADAPLETCADPQPNLRADPQPDPQPNPQPNLRDDSQTECASSSSTTSRPSNRASLNHQAPALALAFPLFLLSTSPRQPRLTLKRHWLYSTILGLPAHFPRPQPLPLQSPWDGLSLELLALLVGAQYGTVAFPPGRLQAELQGGLQAELQGGLQSGLRSSLAVPSSPREGGLAQGLVLPPNRLTEMARTAFLEWVGYYQTA